MTRRPALPVLVTLVALAGATADAWAKPKPKPTPAEETQVSARPDTLPATFRGDLDRGALPLEVEDRKLIWTQDLATLDYASILPLFVSGLAEREEPYAFVAEEGVRQLFAAAPQQVVPVLPDLIRPLRAVLKRRDVGVAKKTLKLLQVLVAAPAADGASEIGTALVPHYPALLPSVSLYLKQGGPMGELTVETLRVLEQYGGAGAGLKIAAVLPDYVPAEGSAEPPINQEESP